MATRALLLKITKLLFIVVFILFVIYMGRGFIRISIFRGYANLFYMPAVNKNFETDFGPINERLRPYMATDLKEFNEGSCHGESFQAFSETVSCVKQEYGQLNISPANIAKWHKEAPTLEQYLLYASWRKQYNEAQPIISLFDSPPGNYSLGDNYAKQHGKTYCNLSIYYSRYVTRDAPQVSKTGAFVNETCGRDVSLFGGFKG